MNSKIISYSAGLANIIGISIFSKLLTNNKLGELDPLFNYIGNILIMLWGFVYIFTKKTYKNPLMIIFFIEKMVYVFNFFYKMAINMSKGMLRLMSFGYLFKK